MTHRPEPYVTPPVKFVRRTADGKYEHGHVLLGIKREDDKYVRTGLVGTYEAAANASQFEPAISHTTYSAGVVYENFHSRNQGNGR